MSGPEPLDFLQKELASDDVEKCVKAMARLRTISLAMGVERTRADLIPYLSKAVDNSLNFDDKPALCDEVQLYVAEVLGGFVEFVGGAQHAHCLLEPLLALCRADESTVRDMAVKSINFIGETLTYAQLKEHLFPALNKLTEPGDGWFPPKVSACGLCKLYYSKVAPFSASERQEVMDIFKKLANEESPMICRAAASKLAGLAEVLEKDDLQSLAEDAKQLKAWLDVPDEIARKNAVNAIPAICSRAVQLNIAEPVTKAALDAYSDRLLAGDRDKEKSWKVRKACAEKIADLAEACKSVPSTREKLQECYLALATNDRENEVKIEAALKADRVAAALGASFAAEQIFPIVKGLFDKPDTLQRVELAGVLAKLVASLDKEKAEELVLPTVEVLLETQADSLNVRLALVGQFELIIDVMGLEINSTVWKLIQKLVTDDKWRMRHAIMMLLPKLAEVLGTGVMEVFGGQHVVKEFLGSGYALIREDFAEMLPTLTHMLGVAWWKEVMQPILMECVDESSSFDIKSHDGQKAANLPQRQSVVLTVVDSMRGSGEGQDLDLDQLQMEPLLQKASKFYESKSPNLRIKTVEVFGSYASGGGSFNDKKRELARTIIEGALTTDDDIDVRQAASAAKEKLG